MQRIKSLVIVVAMSAFSAIAAEPERPPLPYKDLGACPFECCTYQQWTTKAALKTYKTPSTKAAVAFHVKKGQSVRGMTGVVVTSKAGVTEVLKPVELGYALPDGKKPELTLKPGERVYSLHPLGEGMDLFWYKGKVYSDEVTNSSKPTAGETSADKKLKTLSLPEYVWWVKIRNAKEQIGWSQETKKFNHMDGCE